MNISLDLPLPTPPALSPNCTPEQLACVDFIHKSTDHLVIDSVAGSGKSFTLIEQCVAINHYFPLASIALVMFNSKNVPEMQAKITKRGVLKCTVGTVHKFGFDAYKNEHGPCMVNKTKAQDAAAILNKRYKFTFDDVNSIIRMVGLAKDTGVCPSPNHGISNSQWQKVVEEYEVSFKDEAINFNRVCEFASLLFNETINDTTSVDFSDMIALPLYHSYPFRQYDFVLVDEAQDINRCRLLAIIQMLKRGFIRTPEFEQALEDEDFKAASKETDKPLSIVGRLIAVGDRHQSIYAFTGADSKSLDNIKRHFSAHELSLTTCFRCDKAIIRHVNHLVPHIRPRTAAGDGTVNSLTYDKFEELLFGTSKPEAPICCKEKMIQETVTCEEATFYCKSCHNQQVIPISTLPPRDLQSHAILCRKNAPLMRLAFRLSARNIKCRMEGRDIGNSLIYFAKKFNASTPGELGVLISKHLAEQSQKLSPYALETLRDKCECLTVGCTYSTSLKSLFQYIKDIFSDSTDSPTPKLTLSSIHKSKGLEWPTVYILGENLWMPSSLAKTPTAIQQENNLIYVARTRAQHTLTSITMEDTKK